MSSKKDISQIKKYLAGELDANAMHQLERRAQDDPFLMDALEGYETNAGVKQPQLNELADRLQQRVNKKEAKIIPWRTWSIAASIIAALTVGGLWVYNNSEPQPKALVAQVDKVKVAEPPAVNEAAIGASIDSAIKNSEPVAVLKTPAAPVMRSRKFVAINPVSEAAANNKASTVGMLSATLDKEEHPVAKPEEKESASDISEMAVSDYAYQQKSAAKKAEPLSSKNENLLTGKVVDKKDGSPLPGVSIVPAGAQNGVVTDANGDFKINADAAAKLDINYIGYKGKTLNAKDLLAYKSIPLEADSKALNEVVVVGYGVKRKVSITRSASVVNSPAPSEVQPYISWNAYNKYINDNAVSPDGKTGTVIVSFTVSSNGALADFKVTQKLSDKADEQAINMVKDGPKWKGNSDGQPKQASVTINFRKAE